MKIFNELLDFIVSFASPYRKTIVAFLVGTLVTWLVRQGIDPSAESVDALKSGIEGLLIAFMVWLVPNKRV